MGRAVGVAARAVAEKVWGAGPQTLGLEVTLRSWTPTQ